LQLLKVLKTVKFKYENYNFSFDRNGDSEGFYDLVLWKADGRLRRCEKIGRYHVVEQEIEVDMKDVVWFLTANATVRRRRTRNVSPQV